MFGEAVLSRMQGVTAYLADSSAFLGRGCRADGRTAPAGRARSEAPTESAREAGAAARGC